VELCYDGALVMPSNYAIMDEEEMTYVEGGGVELTVKKSYLDKNTCLSTAKNYTSKTGMSKTRIAKKIYAHAVMYYASPALLLVYSTVLGAGMGPIAGAGVLGTLYKKSFQSY